MSIIERNSSNLVYHHKNCSQFCLKHTCMLAALTSQFAITGIASLPLHYRPIYLFGSLRCEVLPCMHTAATPTFPSILETFTALYFELLNQFRFYCDLSLTFFTRACNKGIFESRNAICRIPPSESTFCLQRIIQGVIDGRRQWCKN